MNELKEILNKFAKDVVRDSKRNLTRLKKRSSGSLHKSIGYDLNVSKNSFSLEFLMEQYGIFVDEGVKGADPSKVKGKHPKTIRGQQAPNSQYRFGSGKVKNYKGFIKSLEKWIAKKNLRFRDEKGKFKKGSRKALAHVIAGNIYNRGIKPSLFFTKPFEKHFKNLPDELLEKYGLEIEDFIEHTLKELK
jgi:hypothetical protein